MEEALGSFSSDEDYMSPSFIHSAAATGAVTYVDPRREHPSWKRQAAIEANRRAGGAAGPAKPEAKKLKKIEAESREVGLATAIAPENKGYGMLLKMGFKEGAGLGVRGDGRTTPVAVTVKSDRGGLGRHLALAAKSEAYAKAREANARRVADVSQRQQEEFRARKQRECAEREAYAEQFAMRRACEQLDTAIGLPRSELWIPVPAVAEDGNLKGRGELLEDEATSNKGSAELLRAELAGDTAKVRITYSTSCQPTYYLLRQLLSRCLR